MDTVAAARHLASLVGTLIPGDGIWPAADVVGVQALLATRLVEAKGEATLDDLLAALAAHDTLLDPDPARREAAVTAFEAADPARFKWVRDATFFAYYECPLVVRAMQARGFDYKLRPHVEGYPLPPFDPARDAPRHGRGHWIA